MTGLRRNEALWRALATAAVRHSAGPELPCVLLTTAAPSRGNAGLLVLEAVRSFGQLIEDVVQLLEPADHDRLTAHAWNDV